MMATGPDPMPLTATEKELVQVQEEAAGKKIAKGAFDLTKRLKKRLKAKKAYYEIPGEKEEGEVSEIDENESEVSESESDYRESDESDYDDDDMITAYSPTFFDQLGELEAHRVLVYEKLIKEVVKTKEKKAKETHDAQRAHAKQKKTSTIFTQSR
jgi:hypothetical protein